MFDPKPAADALRSGEPFVCVLDADPAGRAAALEAVVQQAGPGARIIRTGNPLRAPLTLERLMIQAAGTDGTSPYDRSAAELTRILAGAGDTARVVLVIEQAETLDREAIRVLRDMSGAATHAGPRLQVLFSGDPSFRTDLDGTDAAEPPAATQRAADSQAAAAPPPPRDPSPEYMPLPPRERKPRLAWRFLVVLALVLAGAAAAFWVAFPDLGARLLHAARDWAEMLRHGG